MKKKFISVLLALMTASGAAVIPAAAAETEAVGAAADSEAVAAEIEDEAVSAASASAVKLSGTASFNFSAQDYTTWSKVMNSYLTEKSDGTLERVEYCPDDNKLIYEVYSADGKTKKKSGSISVELPLFGGFFSGSDYNYVVKSLFVYSMRSCVDKCFPQMYNKNKQNNLSSVMHDVQTDSMRKVLS